jgi:hypothetical protein
MGRERLIESSLRTAFDLISSMGTFEAETGLASASVCQGSAIE